MRPMAGWCPIYDWLRRCSVERPLTLFDVCRPILTVRKHTAYTYTVVW